MRRLLAALTLLSLAALPADAVTITGRVTIAGSVALKGGGAGAPVAARAGLGAMPTTTGTTPEAGGRIYCEPEYLPSDVSAFNFRIANRDYFSGSGLTSFTANIAAYASDGTGKPTGTAFASYTSQTVPGDVGSASFLSLAFSGATRGSDGKVVVCIGVPQGTTVAYQGSINYGYYSTGSTTVSTAPAGLTGNIASQFFSDISYTTGRRAVVFLGDSITDGYASAFETAMPQLIAADQDISVDAKGIVGIGSLQNFANYSGNPYYWDEQAWSGNPDVAINLGTNDLSYSNAATMKTALLAIIAHVQSLTTGKIYASTVPPQAAYADANGARLTFNADLKANFAGYGITAVRDRAAKQNVGGVADNTTATTLFAGYDVGDGTHLNAAGNVQEKTGWEAIGL